MIYVTKRLLLWEAEYSLIGSSLMDEVKSSPGENTVPCGLGSASINGSRKEPSSVDMEKHVMLQNMVLSFPCQDLMHSWCKSCAGIIAEKKQAE